MQNTDEIIMQSVKDGKLQRATILYDRYHVLLYNYCLRRIGDRSKAEDLMQKVFEKMIKYRSSYKAEANFRSWLFTIARNTVIDEYRGKNLNITATEDIEVSDGGQEASKDRKDVLLHAIGMLPEMDGEIIRMTKIHGFKNKEAGEILGLTESNIKVKTHRAMKQLKNILINQLDYEY